LKRIADATEARFQKAQEERVKATKALKREKDEVLAQLRATQQNVAAQEREKAELQAKLQEEKASATEGKGAVARRTSHGQRSSE
jgi:hypothetical protein